MLNTEKVAQEYWMLEARVGGSAQLSDHLRCLRMLDTIYYIIMMKYNANCTYCENNYYSETVTQYYYMWQGKGKQGKRAIDEPDKFLFLLLIKKST